ncbi:MAG: PAS domain-containing sensor histidine kinase [Candidatus Paceibacterota bacterium]|jgi:PAS domain S-box-containing protein
MKKYMISNLKNPNLFLFFAIVSSAIVLILGGTRAYNIQEDVLKNSEGSQKIGARVENIRFFDEVLTGSTLLAASTGNTQWEKRYRLYKPKLDSAINELLQIDPSHTINQTLKMTESANIQLEVLEHHVFELVHLGKRNEAYEIITGSEYARQKAIHSEGLSTFIKLHKLETDQLQIRLRKEATQSKWAFGLAILLLAIVWLPIERFLRKSRAQILKQNQELELQVLARKESESALFKSKEQYRLLVESAPDVIFTIANDSTFTSLSHAFETLLFWRPEEWIGKSFTGLIHPDDLPRIIGLFKSAMQGEVPSVFESRILTKQGNYLFFEFIIRLVLENGEIKGIMGISRHITERKKAEEKINMLAHAVKNSADCIAITDKDYKIIFVNDSFSKVYGFEKEEIVGQAISVITSKNNLPEVGHSLYSAMVKKEVWTGEVLNKRKDGNDFPVQLSLAPVITDKGEMIAVVGVLRDITERRRAEAELKLKNDQLLKLNAEKDKFFSIIAHDLRSPFNGFMGLTQLLTENTRDLTIDQILKISVNMRNSATNLFRLLENLLQWSRMQQGLIPFDPKVVKLLPLANECIEMHLASAKIKGIEITIDFPSDMEVLADSDMLQTVIRNLVSNAIKFTPIGGRINFSAKTDNDKTIEISISDTGIGMGQEMIGNLFRLDVQANRRGTEGEPSSGLGLLLCKEFIEKHGGKLWVESEEKNLPDGKAGGSTFYFTLP